MKNSIIILGFLFFYTWANAQHNAEFANNGAVVKVENGAVMTVQGDMHNTGSTLSNDGLIEVQGNLYSNNTFQHRGIGTIRLENNDVNIGERQFISGSYAVRGGTAAIGGDDGSFYNLELANTAGLVYLIGGGNVADVRNTIDFLPAGASGTPSRNSLVTDDIGMTGAITYPANGSSYASTFGMMNNTAGSTSFLNNAIDLGGNMSTTDEGYIIGKLRRAIAPAGGIYGYLVGLEPAAINAARGFQYIHLDLGANTYDVIESYFEQGSINNAAVDIECSGYQIDDFWGDRHGEWVFDDINNINGGDYEVRVWQQDPSAPFVGSVWAISKDDVYLYPTPDPLHNVCGATTVGLARGPFNGFSEFGVVSGNVDLPIQLLYLTATPINNQFIRVDWATAKEENVAYFEVERSLDGLTFEKIGNQSAAGNSTNTQYYIKDDYDVLPNVDYYYRIKTINTDGTSEYTHLVVAAIKAGGDYTAVNVYPNPVGKGNFAVDIKSRNEQIVTVQIYDAIGQLIYDKKIKLKVGVKQISVNTDDWASGVYFINVRGNDLNETKEIIKSYH